MAEGRRTLVIVHGGTFRGYPLGGIETFLETVLPHVCVAFDVKLIGRSMGEPLGRWTEITANGCVYPFLPVLPRNGIRFIPDRLALALGMLRYGDEVMDAGAHVFYVHMTEAAIGLLAMSRRPVVVHVHGLYNLFRFSRFRLGAPYAWVYDTVYPSLFSRCAKVIGVGSREEFKTFVEKMRVKSGAVIPTCVRTQIFFPRDRATARRQVGMDPEDKLVLFAGRMTATKNPQLLLDAARTLRKEFPALKIVFLGDGPLRAEIASQASADKNVLVPGRATPEQLALWMNAADVLAVVSRTEAFTSIAALEALSCGTPVVATPVSALPELIREGENGCIAEGFYVEQYSQAVRRALLHPPVREACVDTARPYTPEAVSKQIIAELEEVFAAEQGILRHRPATSSATRGCEQ